MCKNNSASAHGKPARSANQIHMASGLTACSDLGNWWHDRSPPPDAVLRGASIQVPE